MHRCKSILLFLLWSICNDYSSKAQTFDNVPVILRLVNENQQASRGYNFVSQLNTCVYNALLTGQVKLWDSPEKEIQIIAASLKEIERSSNTRFVDCTHLYIYEMWSKNDVEILTTTHGVSFNAKTKTNEVTFGYIDFNEVAALLANQYLNCNANGNSNLTLGYALLTKQFEFQLLQVGNKTYSQETESRHSLKLMLSNQGFNTTLFPALPNQKTITYLIERPASNLPLALQADSLINAMQHDLSVQKILGIHANTEIKKVAVVEKWMLLKQLQTQIQQVTIFTSNDTIVLENAWLDQITINNKSLKEVLQRKDFLYIITKVNEQPIERSKAFLYQRALLNFRWEGIIQQIE